MRHRSRRRIVPVVALLALVLAACPSDDPTGPGTGQTYQLATVDGRPVPAAVDSFVADDGRMRLVRVTGRSIEFVSADSVQYGVATDIAERGSDGGLTPLQFECTSMRIPYRRAGGNVILDFTTLPTKPIPSLDTLRVSGRQLVQRLRSGDAADDPYSMVYRRDEASAPVCQPEG